MRVVREKRPLKCGLISMGDSLCAKLHVLNSVGHSYSPWHECPSPVYPSLHEQWYEPLALEQFALASQVWLLSLHSSTSVDTNYLREKPQYRGKPV